MSEKFTQISDHVKSSFHICNIAISEIWYLTQTPSTEEEIKLARSHTLRFYSTALQYCFIMEYNKLLERNIKRKDQNMASLFRLLEEGKFKSEKESLEILNEITNSTLYNKLKDLRDKKFGHSDNDSINDPWSIKGFKGEQITECVNHLKLILQVMNNCFIESGYTFLSDVPSRDDRTLNFIKYHSMYQKYFYANFKEAYKKGYVIRRKVNRM